jgi:hypothetical protein
MPSSPKPAAKKSTPKLLRKLHQKAAKKVAKEGS